MKSLNELLVELADDAYVDRAARTITLTPEASEACGHWAAEGAGGSQEETRERRRIADLARRLADLTGEQWEIYAQYAHGDGVDCWIVDVLEPPSVWSWDDGSEA